MNRVPPRLPTLEEWKKAIERFGSTKIENDAALNAIGTLHGNLLEWSRWEMVRSAEAYAASANAQTDHDMRRAAEKLIKMWRSWDVRTVGCHGEFEPADLMQAIEDIYK